MSEPRVLREMPEPLATALAPIIADVIIRLTYERLAREEAARAADEQAEKDAA